jgi:hypothetical protein
MMRNQIAKFWNLAAPFLLGAIALAVVILIFPWPGVERAWTATACLMVIALDSLTGRLRASGLRTRWRGEADLRDSGKRCKEALLQNPTIRRPSEVSSP